MRLNASFRFLLAGQALANLADVLVLMSILTFLFDATKSAIVTGLVPIFRVSALLLSGMVAPLVIDRFRLRAILIGSQSGESLIVLALALFFAVGGAGAQVPILFGLVFGIAFLKGWTTPARNSLVPRLVEPGQLVKANSLLATADQSVQMAAWALGGMMISWLGWNRTLWLSLALLLASTVSLRLVRDDQGRQAVKLETVSKRESLQEGWITIWKSPVLRLVTMMDVIEGIANGVWIAGIIIVYVREVLQQGESWFGFINASYYAGTILGGLLVLKLSKWVNRRLVLSMIAGSFSVSLLTFWYALTSTPWMALALCVLMGPAFQLRDIAQRTIFQTNVELSLLPKVYAAQGTVSYATFGLSVTLMGVVADAFGVRLAYGTAAVLFAVSALLAFGMGRGVTTLDKDRQVW